MQKDLKQNNVKGKKMASYSHVLMFTGIFGGVQGLKLFVSLIRNKLSSILLGTTGFGLLGVYSSITEFITNCCNCGIPLNTTQKVSELYENGTPEEMRDFVRIVRTWVVWTAVAALLLSVLLSPLVSYLFFHKEWSHIGEVILLTPVVVAYLVAGGECSLLKGQRQLRSVATIESIVAVTTLLSTVPFYYYWGLNGIIFALIFSTLISAVVHLYFSVRIMPYHITPFRMDVLRKGWPFVRRGLPYVVSGIATSAATMAVPIIILNSGSVDDVGLYRAAFAVMVGYAGMVFVAMEADYYPRLSSVHQHTHQMNRCLNQQIDVCVLLVTPLLILLTLCLPFAIRLLYTREFMSMQTMALLATFYTFFRAVMLPVAYVPLAKGKSMVYLCIELASNLVFCLFIWWGWTVYGLPGIGVALSLTALFDVVVVLLVNGCVYGCRLSARTIRLSVVQFLLLAVHVAVCFHPVLLFKITVGAALFLVSGGYSLHMFRRLRGGHEK